MNPSQPNSKPSWLSRGHHVGEEIPHCGWWPCFPPTHITLMVLQSISTWLMLYPNSPTLHLLLGDIGRGSSDPCSSLIFIASIWTYDGQYLRILGCSLRCWMSNHLRLPPPAWRDRDAKNETVPTVLYGSLGRNSCKRPDFHVLYILCASHLAIYTHGLLWKSHFFEI